MPFDLIKAGATQTETSLFKQYVAGECVDFLDDSNLKWHSPHRAAGAKNGDVGHLFVFLL